MRGSYLAPAEVFLSYNGRAVGRILNIAVWSAKFIRPAVLSVDRYNRNLPA